MNHTLKSTLLLIGLLVFVPFSAPLLANEPSPEQRMIEHCQKRHPEMSLEQCQKKYGSST